MSKYLIIESRDPFDSRDCDWSYGTAKELADSGNEVTVFLVQNGVLPARKGNSYAGKLQELSDSNITLLADDLSLKERAISEELLLDSVKSSEIDIVVELMVEQQYKPIWH